MKKKLISAIVGVAAVSGLSAAHAQSDKARSLTLFGFAHAQFEGAEATGSVNPAQDKPMRSRLSNVSSELGVKGSMAVTPDIKAFFSFITGVSVDNGNNSTTGGLWSSAKDSFVGLEFNNVGVLKLGRMTGAARWLSGTSDFTLSAAGAQDNQGMLTGVSGLTGNAPLFNVRLDNTLGFESASFGGLSFRAYYSANENRSNRVAATGAQLNDFSYSGLVRYVIGPLDLRVSHEVRNDKGTLNASTTNDTQDKDTRLGIRYTLPTKTVLAAGYDRMIFKDSTATGTAKQYLRKSGWVVAVSQPFGPHNVFASFGKAPDLRLVLANGTTVDTASTGAKNFVLGYQYALTKEAVIEAYYSQLNNQVKAKYDFDSGGVGPATGATARSIGAGIRYSF